MTNKKQTIRQLVIYILLSFGIPFILVFLYIANFGWTTDNDWYSPLVSFVMLCPMAANILTHVITKEGTENLCLRIKIKGNIRYFAVALIFPFICGIIIAVLASLMIFPENSLINMAEHFKTTDFLVMCPYLAAVTMASVFQGFGEEFGWRAYMMPKLEKLMPLPAAIIVGGIIWGLWHAPIIACGHNFGTGYTGYPWLGIALMCISCICLGTYLTALTKASKSVIPAALAHIAVNNICGSVSGTMLSYIDIPETTLAQLNAEFSHSLLFMIVVSASALTTGVLILVKNKKNTNK
ncbi:MAG: CPBP family intramembrane metalloprotease [Clostridia bacterium]|nr:CPBP family intramembrane metalloprotease [Clostridia bacterium]